MILVSTQPPPIHLLLLGFSYMLPERGKLEAVESVRSNGVTHMVEFADLFQWKSG
jgi:hypothetical protein